MQTMADRDGVIWFDGELVPWREAKVHVLTHTLHYGMGVFEAPQKESAQENRSWLLQATVDGEVVGLMSYTIKGDEMMNYTLQAPRFYYSNAQGKYLLLEWLARHVDQAGNARIWLPAYEQPNTWLADICPKLEPVFVSPMGRVLDIAGIEGMEVGPGSFTAEISDADCPWNNGTWKFKSDSGKLKVSRNATTSGVMTPKSSAMIGSSPRFFLRERRKSIPGALTQRPFSAVLALPGTAQ